MAELITKRHPIRAALWGFMAGLGILIYLVAVWPVIGLDNAASVAIKSVIVVGGVMVLAVVWSMVAPPKRPKGPQPGAASGEAASPAAETEPPAAEPEAQPEAPAGEPPNESGDEPHV